MTNNAVCTLYPKLCRLGFPYWSAVWEEDLYSGAPYLYTAFIRFILSAYPHALFLFAQKHSWFLLESSDVRLISVIIRLLAVEGPYKVVISLSQFEQRRFANVKATMCLELLRILQQNNSQKPQKFIRTPPLHHLPTLAYKHMNADLIEFRHLVHTRALELNRLHRTP